MFSFILKLLVKFSTSKVAEDLVAIGVSKLLSSTDSGIKKDLALTMINGIVKSKRNSITTKDVFNDAIASLK